MPSTEAKQQTTKRMRGDGSIYRRGATFWICVYVDGRQQRESAKTGDEATALKYLRNRLKEEMCIRDSPCGTCRDRTNASAD